MKAKHATQKYLSATVVASVVTLAGLSAAPAMAEVQASAGVASTYLFRGVDSSDGNAQVFGDLTVTGAGFYASVWGSSAGSGTQEYDLIGGWAKDFDGVNLNLGAINYVYPGDDTADDFGSESEAFIGIGWNGLEAYIYKNVASSHRDNNGYFYTALTYSYKKFSGTFGYAQDDRIPNTMDDEDGKYRYMHLDLTYAFNSNLSFTFSKIMDRKAKAEGVSAKSVSDFADLAAGDARYAAVADDDLLFVVTYSLPLEF